MPDNNAALRKQFNQWAQGMGIIQKAEGGVLDLSTVNFGGLLPRDLVLELISLVRSQSDWLGAINTVTRDRMKGTIPIMDLNEPVMEYVGENDGTKIATTPETRTKAYVCKKFKSDMHITTEELREAAAGGIPNFEQKMTEAWAKQISNDVAELIINSDSSLDSLTRRNRLLRATNGMRIQLDQGNVYDAAGAAWGQGIWAAMLDKMPDRFANDPGLAWMFNRRVNINWHQSLTNVNTTERVRSALGDQAISTPINVPPLGISQLLVPQISSNYGTPLAPTSVVDNTTYMTVRVATILPDATDFSGRRVKITYKPSGLSEVITVTYPGSQNTIVTSGTLGQETVSTTASDYEVQVYDLTDIYLLNPKGINLVFCTAMRSYREFNKDFDRFEITTYLELDTIAPTPETTVKFKNVLVAPITSW